MRAQAELVGLAMVGTIIFLLILFLTPSSTKESIPDDTLAGDYLLALLRTDVQCSGEPVRLSDLMRDCNDCTCRDFAVETLLEATIPQRYDFTLLHNGIDVISLQSKDCEAYTQILVPDRKKVEVRLGIC